MKKTLISLLLALAMLLTTSAALADELEVHMIGGPDVASEPMSLDNIKVGTVYTLDGYADAEPLACMFGDHFAQYNKDADYFHKVDGRYDSWPVYEAEAGKNGDWCRYYASAAWKDSGTNADFLVLRMDVTNLQKKAVKFIEEAKVKIVYDDDYEFEGWVRQINTDYATDVYRYGVETETAPYLVLDPENEEAIDMLYTGKYIFGCTLPNSVVESKAPLRIEIDLGGNELIHHVRQ